jgi:flagellar basal-body rod protein FlgB
MSLLSARQRAVASNIANADTPGYKTKDVDFSTELRNLLQSGAPNTTEVAGLPAKNDGNNVNLEREARLLAENALRFNLSSQLVRMELRSVRSAIQEGRGS